MDMFYGYWQMWTMLRESIDLVIEVRDVRVPFSSSNFFVTDNIPDRVPRIILLNKADLVESYYAKVLLSLKKNQKNPILYP